MDTMDSMGTDTAKYSNIVGVFRDRAHADQAIEALRQAGIGENTIELTEYKPVGAEEEKSSALVASGTSEKGDVISLVADTTSAQRFLVHVRAEGREQEAVAILVSCGSNNSDLPHGTELVEGSIVSTEGATSGSATKHPTPGEPSENFFGTAKAPGHPADISIMDKPTPPSH